MLRQLQLQQKSLFHHQKNAEYDMKVPADM